MGNTKTIRESGVAFALRSLVCTFLAVVVLNAASHLDFRHPFIGYGFGGILLLYWTAELSAKRRAMVVILGGLLSVWIASGGYEGLASLLAQVIGAFGLASLFLLACVVFWNGRDREPSAYRALVPAIALMSLFLSAQSALNLASSLHRETLDFYAFAFDGSLGFEPSFALGRFVNARLWLLPFAKVSYEGIPLAIAALYAGFMRRRRQPIWEIIGAFVVSTVIGYILFSIFPVCGPSYAFGKNFPSQYVPYPALRHMALEKVSLPLSDPRNGVPSLHMTWALLIWLNTRSLHRGARWAAGALVLATAFDTLASGEHYLFDLVVALPFTLWMHACMALTVSIRDRRRWLPALCGCGLFLVWLVIGRFGIHFLMISPVLPWLLIGASSTVTIVWAMKLPAMIPEMQGVDL